MAKNKIATSARLRATLKVSDLVGINYDMRHFPFGGFFSTLELEQIAKRLEELKAKSKS
jgi:hypothetical protein